MLNLKPFIGLWGNKHISWDVITSNVLAGFVNAAGAPGEIDFEQGKSYEISVLNAAAIRCSINSTHSSISAGIGISWRNYRTTTGMQLTHGNDGSVGYEPFPDDVSPRYSRLKVFSPSAFSLINTSTPVACNTVSVDAVMALSPIAVKMEHMAEIYLNRIVS